MNPFWDNVIFIVHLKPPNLEYCFHLKHIHAPQRNVFTHNASEAMLSSLCIWTPHQEYFLHLSIVMFLRAICSHMLLLTQFYSHCAFQMPNFENYTYLRIFMFPRVMRPHLLLSTPFYPHSAFEASNMEYCLHLSIFMLLRPVCSHVMLLTQCYPHCAFQISI